MDRAHTPDFVQKSLSLFGQRFDLNRSSSGHYLSCPTACHTQLTPLPVRTLEAPVYDVIAAPSIAAGAVARQGVIQ